MLTTTFVTILLVFGLLAGWVGVQALARRFAARHPELGEAREEGGGCLGCLCQHAGTCQRRRLAERSTP